MKDKKEFVLCVSVFLFVLTLIDIGVVKYALNNIQMNGATFRTAGMMEYINPTDHRTLWIPIYEKVITK